MMGLYFLTIDIRCISRLVHASKVLMPFIDRDETSVKKMLSLGQSFDAIKSRYLCRCPDGGCLRAWEVEKVKERHRICSHLTTSLIKRERIWRQGSMLI
jgi:hypothetical protein